MAVIPTPAEGKQITDYTAGVFDGASLLYQSKGGTGYKVSGDDVANYVATDKVYPSIGGCSIIEGIGKVITGSLPAGQTTVTFSDASISDDSMFDVYVDDAFIGVVPTALTVSTVGTPSVTLTFDEQSSDMPVRLVVKGG